jgi:hypothetical protein
MNTSKREEWGMLQAYQKYRALRVSAAFTIPSNEAKLRRLNKWAFRYTFNDGSTLLLCMWSSSAKVYAPDGTMVCIGTLRANAPGD